MMRTSKIAIDLDVHRAIENRRTSFDQSHNAILRDILGLSLAPSSAVYPERTPRRTGTYAFTLRGNRIAAGSLKQMYTECLRKLGELDPQFFDRLSEQSTRSRKIIAKKPADLYARKPELAEKHAFHLTGPWWVDTNLSRLQCEKRLQTACELVGLRFGGERGDLILEFPG